MRGRKPTPIPLRRVKGNPRRRPLPPEPKVVTTLPPPPAILNEEARREWYRAGRLLRAAGVISSLDRGVFALYCATWARWLEATTEVRKHGSITMTRSGYPQLSAYLVVEQQTMRQLASLGEQLGMSPVSRSRIKTNGFLNAANEDPIA